MKSQTIIPAASTFIVTLINLYGCTTPTPPITTTSPADDQPFIEAPTLALADERHDYENSFFNYLQIMIPGESALTMETQDIYMNEKGPSLAQLYADAEKMFTISEGDREVFGWHLYRKIQSSMSMMCLFPLNIFPDDVPEEAQAQMRISYNETTLNQINVMLMKLEPFIDEASPSWREHLLNAFQLMSVEGNSAAEVCQATRHLWHPDEFQPFDKLVTAEAPTYVEDAEALLARLSPNRPPLTDEEALASPGVVGTQMLTDEALEAMRDSDETYLVFLGGSGCNPSENFARWAAPFFEEHELLDRTFVVSFNHPSTEVLQSVYSYELATPTLIALKRGVPVDYRSGGFSDEKVDLHAPNFLIQNGFIEGEIALERDYRDLSDERTRIWLQRGSGSSNFTNLSGANLQNISYRFANFSGSILRDADLRGAIIPNVNFAHADLTGANLEGANVEGALWYRTVCPDGSMSEEHGGTCEGTW